MRRDQKVGTRSVFRVVIATGWIFFGVFSAASQTARSMAVMQTRYEVKVGEPIEVPVAADTRDFIAHAKTRRVTIDGQDVPGLVVALNETQDKILLAPNSKATPGEYAVTLSATGATGEEMSSEVDVVVKPRATVPKSSTRSPVVLMNGWISGYNGGTCTISSNSSVTFGNLAQYLVNDGVPVVYLFDNCVEDPNQTIETLGQDLATFLSTIKYDDGTQVTQIDVVAHSIGGLIARAYLESLHTDETYHPPYSPLIHNLVLIATPNFGSFLVGNTTTGLLVAGTQTGELIPGSAVLWNLATWNQRGDDLAGVNAIAIVGNAGAYSVPTSTTELLNASDGLVSTTSASLGFMIPAPTTNPTRVVPYCHVDPSVFTTTIFGTFNCNAPGIANVTSTTHPTSQIVLSFLKGTTAWQSIGTSPTADTYLKGNGGAFFALQNVQAGYANDLTSVKWGNVTLTDGGNVETIYYTDFVTGTGDFTAKSTSLGSFNCGSLPVPAGSFSAFRCKLNLAITCPPASTSCTGAVTPTTTPGTAVTSGTTLTIAGEDFGTQCSSCKVYATPAGATTATALTVSKWTNTAISVQLPTSIDGYLTLQVNAVAGVDAIGVRALAASTAAPVLTLGSTSLNFAYTAGGTLPSSQPVTISNTGTGTLVWTASVTSTAKWLSLDLTSGTAPSTVNVTVSPASLSAGTYNGTVTIASSGASGSPATVAVTLVVSAAAASVVVSPTSLSFQYAVGGTVPASQNVTINNGGGGSFTWVASSSAYWVALSPVSGSLPGTVAVSVIPQNLAAGTSNANVTIGASDGSVTPLTIPVTITVTGTPPTPAITAVVNAAGYQTNFAAATWVSIFGTNLSQITYAWQASDIVNGALPTSLQGVSVTINGIAAYISYISPTQINLLAPDDTTTASVPVVVTVAGQASAPFNGTRNQFSPAFFTVGGTHVVGARFPDNTLLGPPGLYPGVTTTAAAAGDVVILYATGLGPTSPSVPTSQEVPGGEPLVATSTVTMTIGGVPATISFVGLSGSGLYQFNVTVPSGLTTGDAALSATINGTTTQTGVVLTVK
jgi:uncharacterized protein (TIGR03437 family)